MHGKQGGSVTITAEAGGKTATYIVTVEDIIGFYIDGVIYYSKKGAGAYEGVTWEDWAKNNYYNTIGCVIKNGMIFKRRRFRVCFV